MIGAHGDRLSSPSGDLGDTISRRLVNSTPGPPSSTSTLGPAYKYTGPSWLYSKHEEIRAGPDSGSPFSRNSLTPGLRGSFPSRVQSLGDSCSRTPSILPPSTNLSSSVPAYGITQLGLRSYPLGRLYLRPLQRHFCSLGLTDRFTTSIRFTGPCQPSTAVAGLRFLTSGIPIRTFQAELTIFTDAFTQGWGAHMWDSQISGTWTCTDRKLWPYQLSGAQGGSLCPTALGPSAPGPPGYDCYGQFNSSFVYQQTRRDPFPHLATFDSRASPLVRGSEHI